MTGDIGFGGSWMANAWTVRYEMARRCFRDSFSGRPAASHSTGSLHSLHSGSMVSATLPARRLRPCLPINCFHFDRSLVGRPGAPFGSRRSAEDAGRQNARHIHGHCPKIGAWTSFACMLSESLLPALRHRPVIRGSQLTPKAVTARLRMNVQRPSSAPRHASIEEAVR